MGRRFFQEPVTGKRRRCASRKGQRVRLSHFRKGRLPGAILAGRWRQAEPLDARPMVFSTNPVSQPRVARGPPGLLPCARIERQYTVLGAERIKMNRMRTTVRLMVPVGVRRIFESVFRKLVPISAQ